MSAPTCTSMAAGAVSLKNPHHIITLRFSEAVKDHANRKCMRKYKNNLRLVRQLDQSNPESLVYFFNSSEMFGRAKHHY